MLFLAVEKGFVHLAQLVQNLGIHAWELSIVEVVTLSNFLNHSPALQIESLQDALVQSKEDNKKLAGTLEAVMTSHTQLQSTCENLQTELGKRDSRLMYLEKER